MFGKLLSSGIKLVTLPIDAANISLDVMTGGSGSKNSRNTRSVGLPNPLAAGEEIRDKIAEVLEDLDE